MDFWSLGLPWNEPLAIIIDSAVNRLESNGFRDQLWNKKRSGNKQTLGREKLTQTMISRSGNLQNSITPRPFPNQLSAPSSLIVCSKFSSRHKGRVRLPNRMNFRKNSKRSDSMKCMHMISRDRDHSEGWGSTAVWNLSENLSNF